MFMPIGSGEFEGGEDVKGRCPLCFHDDREQIEVELAKGNITKKVVAAELEMELEAVHEHMMNHFTVGGFSVEDLTPTKLRDAYNKKDVLFNSMISLKERLDVYIAKDQFSPNETKQIVAMAAELRKSVMDLAKLEDEISTEKHITIYMYNNLKMMILSTLCLDCKAKVMEALEKDEKKVVEELDITELAKQGKVT